MGMIDQEHWGSYEDHACGGGKETCNKEAGKMICKWCCGEVLKKHLRE